MVSVFNEYKDYITGRPTTRGGVYHVDMLPTTCHVYFGDVMIATPNGRLLIILCLRVSLLRRVLISTDRPQLLNPAPR